MFKRSRKKPDWLDKGTPAPRITEPLHLGRYHEAYKGDYVQVWVNWTQDYWQRLEAFAQQDAADVWDPGLTAELLDLDEDEVKAIFEKEPNLLEWIINQATEKRRMFRVKRELMGGRDG